MKHGIATLNSAQSRIFDIASEIRALAYLFETQGSKAAQISESDLDEIGHGIGRMLRRMARQVRRVGRDMDEGACRAASTRSS